MAFLGALLELVALVLISASVEIGTIVLILVTIAQAGILLKAPLRTFVWSPTETPAASP